MEWASLFSGYLLRSPVDDRLQQVCGKGFATSIWDLWFLCLRESDLNWSWAKPGYLIHNTRYEV